MSFVFLSFLSPSLGENFIKFESKYHTLFTIYPKMWTEVRGISDHRAVFFPESTVV